jgi:hypothetical protein
MSADTIALPSHLVDTLYRGVTLYRGTWSTETRQGTVYRRGNTVRQVTNREIWIKLPSGRDLLVQHQGSSFSGLPGHRVGVMVNRQNRLIVGINYDTGERAQHHTYHGRREGLGCLAIFLWLGVAVALGIWLIIRNTFPVPSWWAFTWFIGIALALILSRKVVGLWRKDDARAEEYVRVLASGEAA